MKTYKSLLLTFHFVILRYYSSESGPGMILIAKTLLSILDMLAGILIS
jgi:hypothetical protein